MRKFFIILLTLVMLVGCGQLPNDVSEDEQLNVPDIVFMERVYNDNNGFISIAFTDSNSNYYSSVDKEVCNLSFAELVDRYRSGGLDGRITQKGYYNTDGLRDNYEKLCNAVHQDDCDIVYPEMLPDVETESYSWYGLYYDENNELKSQIIHVNECMTSLYSANDTINEIYKWYNDDYIAIDA